MLTPDQVTGSDRFVRFFYEQIGKSPSTLNGRDIAEYSEEYRRMECIGLSLYKYEPEKVEAAKAEGQVAAAKESGVDRLGIERLVTRMPAIFYFILEGEEKELTCPFEANRHGDLGHCKNMSVYYGEGKSVPADISALAKRQLEIGLNPDVLKSYNWCHDNFDGVAASWYNGGIHKNPDKVGKYDIASFVEKQLEEDIQVAYSGLVYHGLDSQGLGRLLAFVDTSESSRLIESRGDIAERCAELVARYGLDGLFTLSAEKHIPKETDGFWSRGDWKVSKEARLDAGDGEHVNLRMTNLVSALDTIKKGWQEETFKRQVMQHFHSSGELTAGDAGQGIRDFLRARMEYCMQARAYELLEAELKAK